MIEIQSSMAVRLIEPKTFGKQQLGYPPGGPADHFSAARCQSVLGEVAEAPILEWDVLPLRIVVSTSCRVVIGGCPRTICHNGANRRRYQVLSLEAGDQLDLGVAEGGFVGYLAMEGEVMQLSPQCFASRRKTSDHPVGIDCPAWSQSGAWAPRKGTLRCLPGPDWEHDFLDLLAGPWRMDMRRDRRGIRLNGPPLPPHMTYDVHPAPLVDGTVQLTRSGPIILMRDRGTIGGYPRAWVIIEPDIDIAAQMPTGFPFAFHLVSREEALAIDLHKQACLAKIVPQ